MPRLRYATVVAGLAMSLFGGRSYVARAEEPPPAPASDPARDATVARAAALNVRFEALRAEARLVEATLVIRAAS